MCRPLSLALGWVLGRLAGGYGAAVRKPNPLLQYSMRSIGVSISLIRRRCTVLGDPRRSLARHWPTVAAETARFSQPRSALSGQTRAKYSAILLLLGFRRKSRIP